MKIAFVSKLYPNYLNDFFSRHPEAVRAGYQELHELIINDHFQFYSSLVKELRKQGHEGRMIYPAFDLLNHKWQKEKGVSTGEGDAALQQIGEFKPDLVFINSNFEYFGSLKKAMLDQGIPVCVWISCPYPTNLDLSGIKTIFTLFPPHQETFQKQGIRSVLVNAGFDEEVLKLAENPPKILSDVSFVGGIGKFHREREKILMYLCKRLPVNLFGYGYTSPNPIKNFLKQVYYRFAFTKCYQGQAWGMKMFNILNGSKITLNIHGDISSGHSVNMRLFEATGMGTLLLTEDNPGIRELFVPGEEVVVFTSKEDALAKAKYYLVHAEERVEIARKGQAKTLSRYRYSDISAIFIEEFQRIIDEGR